MNASDSPRAGARPGEALRFLGTAASHPGGGPVEVVETHMSWLFLSGERVLKLKKPVRHPFLDFSTTDARLRNCREEVRLNSRLAPGVYLGVLALHATDGGLALCAERDLPPQAHVVDWVVAMRRLPGDRTLQALVERGEATPAQIDALATVLSAFYRRAPAVPLTPQGYVDHLVQGLAWSRRVLLRPGFALRDAARVIDRHAAAIARHASMLRARAAQRRIVDGHGDLRPEHVWLLRPPVVIDCLEFNAALRRVDPFDELAFLGLECALGGAAWIGERLVARCADALGDRPPPGLVDLYTAQRALLRGQLALAHLFDAHPRTPARWRPLAERYLGCAAAALDRLDGRARPATPGPSPGTP